MKKKTSGFTLIELLIVVAIIAILAAIAVPNFLEAQTRAKVSRAKADLRTLDTGIKAYQVDHNKPPREYNSTVYGDPVVAPGTSTSGIVFPGNTSTYGVSTPIAYVTTAFFFDPFVNQGDASIDFDQQTFSYMNIYAREELGATIFGASDGASQQQAFDAHKGYFGLWKITCIGPDRDYFNNIANPGTRLLAYAENLPYDPSNGTISQGNIVRGEGVTESNPPVRTGLLGSH